MRPFLIPALLFAALAAACSEAAEPDPLLLRWCSQGKTEQQVDCACLARHIEEELPAGPLEVIRTFAVEEMDNGKSPEAARISLEEQYGRERARNAFAEFVIIRESGRSLCQTGSE
ncbi:MAG: hypothetical protein R3360_02205 [Alphaproteobacteria bacterium]|nr:hypothetical protein [Alphaproteobacteria bacterium]